MPDYQFWTLVGMLAAGFGWVIHRLTDIDKRLTVVETILSMMGAPISIPRKKSSGDNP